MASVVAAMAMTHAPGLTGWFTRASEEYQQLTLQATAEMRRRLEATRPDVVVMFSNDHLLNWPINNTPEYTVGIGEEHVGPAEWFDEWLAMEQFRVPGHAALARWIVNEGARRGLPFAYLRQMQFDDGISVPMHYLNPEGAIALVPVTMNCTVPPVPTPERCYQVGTVLRDLLKAFPGQERIAIMATGGLSHEPGGPPVTSVGGAGRPRPPRRSGRRPAAPPPPPSRHIAEARGGGPGSPQERASAVPLPNP